MLSTTIGRGVLIRGALECGEKLIVRGKLFADVTSSEAVHIERSGVVKATIRAKTVRVCGVVCGDIEAEGPVEITATGRVVGGIKALTLRIHDGGAFRGRVHMTEAVRPVEVEDASTAALHGDVVHQDSAPSRRVRRPARGSTRGVQQPLADEESASVPDGELIYDATPELRLEDATTWHPGDLPLAGADDEAPDDDPAGPPP